MQVRDARPEDAAVIVELNARLAQETEGRVPDRQVLARGVERGLLRRDLCRYFVAEDAATIVGQVMVTWEWSDWRNGVVWWFQSVYVLPDRRGSGVFRALFRHVERAARLDPDARGLRLYVEEDNVHARAVYTALGLGETTYRVHELDWSGVMRRV